ncbi:MAG: competence/damage-inducible protein A [Bacteroidales bacterium]|nr:competence/damage-inducible protein A [Bacteroidales bacterium]
MYADIITIGDEILIGQVVDTNSVFIASELNSSGIRVRMIRSIADAVDDISKTLDDSIQNSDIVILTGGLGPTNDDITKNALAAYFGSRLVIHEESLRHIRSFLSSRGVKVTERNTRQAQVPENCKVLINKHGSAPGMVFRKGKKMIISLPGVPYEMRALVTEEVIPVLHKEFSLPCRLHRTVLTTAVAESMMADTLEDWEKTLTENIALAYLPSPGLLRLRLSVTGSDKKRTENLLEKKLAELINLVGEKNIFGFDDDTLASVVGRLLLEKRATLSVAESCTGGNIAHMITGVPGSSAYFKGSVTAYSNEIKTNVLGVQEHDIQTCGAVSREVVEQMAKGIRAKFETDYAISTSGIAGPEGGTKEKPLGTTWIAIATPKQVISKKFLLGDHRGRNITKASLYALNMLRNVLMQVC